MHTSPRASAHHTTARHTSSPKPGFDVEAWRRRTIKKYGPERTYEDGSKFDYVVAAYAICDNKDRPAYEQGSLQDYVVQTFCPNV